MNTMIGNGRKSFPELVGRSAQQAATYVAAQGIILLPMLFLSITVLVGFRPQILGPHDPTTKDLRMDRVRIIVDPAQMIVIQVPIVG